MSKPIIISAPSAAGKTTIRNAFLKRFPEQLERVITVTTRDKRPGEVDGIDYFFLTENEFAEKIRNEDFIEYTKVYEHWYGSLKSQISNILDKGKYPVIVLDVIGKKKYEEVFPEHYSFFILPGSKEEIEKRLRERNSTEEDIKIRLESVDKEIEESSHYQKIIHNESKLDEVIEEFSKEIKHIIEDDNEKKFRETLETCDEVRLFTIIEGLMGIMHSINLQINEGKIKIDDNLEKDFSNVKNSLMIAAEFTKKFGVMEALVDFNAPKTKLETNNIYKTLSEEFCKWLAFWASWKTSLTYDQWIEVDRGLSEDLDKIPNLPIKKWNEIP